MTLGSLSSLAGLLKKASLAGAFFVPAIWLSAVQAQALCPAPQPLSYAQVERVVDGDTLRLKDGRSVRMIGLNAPETGKKGQSAEPFADAARKRLQTLVALSDGRVGCCPASRPRTVTAVPWLMSLVPMAAIWKRSCWPMAWPIRSR